MLFTTAMCAVPSMATATTTLPARLPIAAATAAVAAALAFAVLPEFAATTLVATAAMLLGLATTATTTLATAAVLPFTATTAAMLLRLATAAAAIAPTLGRSGRRSGSRRSRLIGAAALLGGRHEIGALAARVSTIALGTLLRLGATVGLTLTRF